MLIDCRLFVDFVRKVDLSHAELLEKFEPHPPSTTRLGLRCLVVVTDAMDRYDAMFNMSLELVSVMLQRNPLLKIVVARAGPAQRVIDVQTETMLAVHRLCRGRKIRILQHGGSCRLDANGIFIVLGGGLRGGRRGISVRHAGMRLASLGVAGRGCCREGG